MNKLREIAKRYKRQYITPEDVTKAYEEGATYDELAFEFLAILGTWSPEHSEFAFEDRNLIAFLIIEQ